MLIRLRVLLLMILFIVSTLTFFLYVTKYHHRPNNSSDKISDYLFKASTDCNRLTERNTCYQAAAKEVLAKFSFADVLTGFKQLEDSNPQNSCHDIMHFLASEEFRKGRNLPQLFNQCTSVCFNACYHGAVLGYITQSNLAGVAVETLTKTITHACDSLEISSKVVFKENCVHGVGHSLMLITENQLLRSLELCDSFTSIADRQTCYGGVFMENFPNSSSSDHSSKYLNPKDPLYPCNLVDERYSSVCYLFIADYFNYLNSHNSEKTIQMCQIVPQKHRNGCYRTIGISIAGSFQDPNEMVGICNLVPDGQPKEYCVQGAVISFADKYGGDRENFLKMFNFCDVVEPAYKKICYNQIGLNLKKWVLNEQDRLSLCSKIKNFQEKSWCINGPP